MDMVDSIRARVSDGDNVLGPFLGNLPPEILDKVVEQLGWFQTTFAMAGRTCREAVERVLSTRAVLTEKDRGVVNPLAVAVMDADVEALEWLIQLFDGKGLKWRDYCGTGLCGIAAEQGKIESLTCLRVNGCPWNKWTCETAAYEGHQGSAAVGASERVPVGRGHVRQRGV